jgi:hypothetical protein
MIIANCRVQISLIGSHVDNRPFLLKKEEGTSQTFHRTRTLRVHSPQFALVNAQSSRQTAHVTSILTRHRRNVIQHLQRAMRRLGVSHSNFTRLPCDNVVTRLEVHQIEHHRRDCSCSNWQMQSASYCARFVGKTQTTRTHVVPMTLAVAVALLAHSWHQVW